MDSGEGPLTPEALRAIIRWLRDRVQPGPEPGSVRFVPPTLEEMTAAGLHRGGCRRLLAVPWWEEMVAEILETPRFAGPDTPADTVLRWARDVPEEWIRKRFPLEP